MSEIMNILFILLRELFIILIWYFLILSFIYPVSTFRALRGRADYDLNYCGDERTLKQELYVKLDFWAGNVDMDPRERNRIVKAIYNEIVSFLDSKPGNEGEGLRSDKVFYVFDVAILDVNNLYYGNMDNAVIVTISYININVDINSMTWFREVFFKQIRSCDVFAELYTVYEVDKVKYRVIKDPPRY